jgi:hypothetical protein
MCNDHLTEVDQLTFKDIKYSNAYDIKKRSADYKDFLYFYEEIIRVIRGYPKVHFRYLISPLSKLGAGDFIPIFDDASVGIGYMAQGKKEGAEILDYYLGKTQVKPANHLGFDDIKRMVW